MDSSKTATLAPRRFRMLASACATSLLLTGAGLASAHGTASGSETGPKNVLVFVADGLGHNQIAATNLYETGQSMWMLDTDTGTGETSYVEGDPVQTYETWGHAAMSTYDAEGSYNPEAAWSDFGYVRDGWTESAESATAMATGHKTSDDKVGLDADGNVVENVTERALSLGKAAGVVSSVPFSHATPAAFAVHAESRYDTHDIAASMIDSDLSVVMGAGHPYFDDDNEPVDTPDFEHIPESSFESLSSGATDWSYIEERDDFEALATSDDPPEHVFGIAQVFGTLQQARERTGEEEEPYEVPLNEGVPTLETMTEGALNVLGEDQNGLFLMVESGATDWAGHHNEIGRVIEEMQDFNRSVESAVDWVETESSWDETLIIIASDHETGYLSGPDSDPHWTPLEGAEGELPSVGWYNENFHTNMLVPMFAAGAGSQDLLDRATNTDPVRGAYLDNTDIGSVILDELWAEDAPVDAVADLRASLDAYVESGDVGGPLRSQLGNALQQAHHHAEGGREEQAAKAVERSIRHLEEPKPPDTLTAEANEDLHTQAVAILDMLR